MYCKSNEYNTEQMKLICDKHKNSPSITRLFYYGHLSKDLISEGKENVSTSTITEPNNGTVNVTDVCQNIQRQSLLDIQKQFLQSLGTDSKFGIDDDCVSVSEILREEQLVLKDEVFVQHCQRALQLNSANASLFSKLALLPKLNSFQGKMSQPVMDAIIEFFLKHKRETVDSCFCVLLSQHDCGSGYTDLLMYVLASSEANLNTDLLVALLRALSKKQPIVDGDLGIFSCITKQMDLSDGISQKITVEFLEKCSLQFVNSVKFGQCLLSFLQSISVGIHDLAVLDSIINSHKSCMKKVIEKQYNKLRKM